MHFTPEQIRMLAQCERDMDAGNVPFVRVDGLGRMLVNPLVMEELGLVSGQTVSAAMQLPIMEANMRAMMAVIELDDVVKA